MSIVVACRCGQSFAAPDQYAGQILPCPVCGSGIQIPWPQSNVAPFEPTGFGHDPFAGAGDDWIRIIIVDTQPKPIQITVMSYGADHTMSAEAEQVIQSFRKR